MHTPHLFLKALATVLCVAAVTTVIFQRLRLPVVLGYVLAGMLVGPHLPVPIFADRTVVETLAELGVILLMFSIGLEFSLRKLVRIGPTAGIVVIIEVSCMFWLGYLAGRLLGWTPTEALFTGAIVSISSTMVIAKSFSEQRRERQHVELVFGVLVFEDLMAILLLATLTALSAGGLSASMLLSAVARLIGFLLALLVFGILIIPRLVRFVDRLGSAETLLVACVGLCFALALLAQAAGYSVALGAFSCGALVAESNAGKRIEPLIHPVRDLFGAIFFVSVGMMIDPYIIIRHWGGALVLTAVVLGGKIISVSLGAFLSGYSIRASLQAAMTLAQIGEFSFIIAAVGLSQGATREFLYPLAVAVSVITALTTPWLMRASAAAAAYVDRRLPRPLQTFAALYAAWVERLRAHPAGRGADIKRLIKVALIDDVCLAGLAIGASLSMDRLAPWVARVGHLLPNVARAVLAAAALLLSVPLWIGLVRSARRLGAVLAARAIPLAATGGVDLGAAPRHALTRTLEILMLLVLVAPLLAVTQPFLPSLPGALGGVLLVALFAVLGVAFVRSTTHLLGHVRAGAQAIVEALAAQGTAAAEDSEHGEPSGPAALSTVLSELLSGLGTWATERIAETAPCVGKTLAHLNLRGLTGATVLAIQRGTEGVAAPTAQEVLRAGDTLVLAGSAESIERARRLLRSGPAQDDENSYEFFAITGK